MENNEENQPEADPHLAGILSDELLAEDLDNEAELDDLPV